MHLHQVKNNLSVILKHPLEQRCHYDKIQYEILISCHLNRHFQARKQAGNYMGIELHCLDFADTEVQHQSRRTLVIWS